MSTDLYRKCSKCGFTPYQDESLQFHRFPKPGKTNKYFADDTITREISSTGILTSINVRKVKDLNKREQRLYAKCRRYTKELSRLRKKLTLKKRVDAIKTLHENESLKKLFELNITSSFAVLEQCFQETNNAGYNLLNATPKFSHIFLSLYSARNRELKVPKTH